MVFTEATGNSTTYLVVNPSESIWDNGASKWDYNGNVYATSWDTTKTAYTEQGANTPIYREPKPSSLWDSNSSKWDVIGNVETTLWDT